MTVWGNGQLADQRLAELRRMGAGPGQTGGNQQNGRLLGGKRGKALCAWVGYRMIGVGCRLARPAIVAGARSGM